jgi:predicted neutral ceramidase superfamily lipid hydrolase
MEKRAQHVFTRSLMHLGEHQGRILTFCGAKVAIFREARATRVFGFAILKRLLMSNIAPWFIYLVGAAIIFACLATIALGLVGTLILVTIKNVVQQELRQDILPSVAGTLRNVEKMSTDAAATTHNVTGAANRVSNLVGNAANRLESPIIRAVGLASGLLAAGRSVRGGKKTVVVEKKRKGLF